MVDIDKEAVDICRRFLPSLSQGSFEDSRAELLYCDARGYLAEHQEKFDVIIIDLTEPQKEGPSYLLYTQEFYRLVQERLAPEGIMSVQAGTCSLEELLTFSAINNTLRSVFPLVFPYEAYVPSFGGLWGFAIASTKLSPLPLSVAEVDRRVSVKISKNLRFYDGLAHQGMFSLPKYLRQEMSQKKMIITDDNPQFVY
jgi:spermidine synthase